jgi:glycosyltransferase involved in cell wall biosynthesis
LFTYTTTAAARAAREAGVPYVVRPMGSLDSWGVSRRRPWLKRASLRWVEGPVLRGAAAVHFTSADEARQAEGLGIAMRPQIVPLGVTVTLDAPPARAAGTRPRLLYLSRLDPKKNLEGLFGALAFLRKEGTTLPLTIAGDGHIHYLNSLRTSAQACGITDQLTWLGRVDGQAKERALAQADAFVLPSFAENFGIAAAEALAAALPCVLGAGVALAKDVGPAGAGVVVGTTPTDIAAGLRLIIDPRARDTMAHNALRLAREQLSLQAMGANLERLYAKILADRRTDRTAPTAR